MHAGKGVKIILLIGKNYINPNETMISAISNTKNLRMKIFELQYD